MEEPMSALDLDQTPGRCAFCDNPLPIGHVTKRCYVSCGSDECRKAYLAEWYVQRRGEKLRAVERQYGDSETGYFTELVCGHVMPLRGSIRNRGVRRRRCTICNSGGLQ
jgi:hypothetical protein